MRDTYKAVEVSAGADMNILYTTETVVEGGRASHGRTSAPAECAEYD